MRIKVSSNSETPSSPSTHIVWNQHGIGGYKRIQREKIQSRRAVQMMNLYSHEGVLVQPGQDSDFRTDELDGCTGEVFVGRTTSARRLAILIILSKGSL